MLSRGLLSVRPDDDEDIWSLEKYIQANSYFIKINYLKTEWITNSTMYLLRQWNEKRRKSNFTGFDFSTWALIDFNGMSTRLALFYV